MLAQLFHHLFTKDFCGCFPSQAFAGRIVELVADGSVALFESFRCSALDLRLCGFIEQVCNEFNFVVNAGFVVCKMSLLDSSECFNSFQCVFGRA